MRFRYILQISGISEIPVYRYDWKRHTAKPICDLIPVFSVYNSEVEKVSDPGSLSSQKSQKAPRVELFAKNFTEIFQVW